MNLEQARREHAKDKSGIWDNLEAYFANFNEWSERLIMFAFYGIGYNPAARMRRIR